MAISQDKLKSNLSPMKLAFLRYHKLLTLFLAIVLLVFSYYFILAPKYQQVGGGGRYNLDTLKEELEKRQSYLKDLQTLISSQRQISQTDLERLAVILPDQKDIAGLFIQLQQLAQNNNLLLASVNINEIAEVKPPVKSSKTSKKDEKPLPPTNEPKKLDINLNLLGPTRVSYSEIKNFLADLENHLRLFDVNAVYFTPDLAAWSVNLYTYYLSQDKK
jgi:hypothetical protein